MSIKKIASEVGVSTATVSRVLNNPNHKCLDEEKRKKILSLAREMNYVPNQAARNLRIGKNDEKTYYINILVTRGEEVQADPFFSELLRVIESEIHNQMCVLSQVIYRTVFSNEKKCKNANIDEKVKDVWEICNCQSDGLVILGHCSAIVIKSLKKYFKNIVLISRNFRIDGVDAVTCAGAKMAKTAIEYLIELGHTDIAYVGNCQNENRYHGYIQTLEKHELLVDSKNIFESAKSEAAGFEAMNKILAMEEPPTAVYCANDIIAVGMLKCLQRKRNLDMIPSIISSDGIELAEHTKPLLTTVAMPLEEMAYYAVTHLLTRIKRGGKNNVIIEFEGKLIKRDSCKEFCGLNDVEYYI